MLHVPIHILPTIYYTLTLLNFKVAVATYMIGPYTSRKRATQGNKIELKRGYRYKHEPTEVPNYLPEFQQNRHRCVYCYAGRIDRKTFVKCSECGVFLCLVKERNCFYKHHQSSFIFINFLIFI